MRGCRQRPNATFCIRCIVVARKMHRWAARNAIKQFVWQKSCWYVPHRFCVIRTEKKTPNTISTVWHCLHLECLELSQSVCMKMFHVMSLVKWHIHSSAYLTKLVGGRSPRTIFKHFFFVLFLFRLLVSLHIYTLKAARHFWICVPFLLTIQVVILSASHHFINVCQALLILFRAQMMHTDFS